MSEQRNKITDAIMRFFLPNSHRAMGGTPQEGAPNPFTPPLWRDLRNPDDPFSTVQQGYRMPEDPRMRGWR